MPLAICIALTFWKPNASHLVGTGLFTSAFIDGEPQLVFGLVKTTFESNSKLCTLADNVPGPYMLLPTIHTPQKMLPLSSHCY